MTNYTWLDKSSQFDLAFNGDIDIGGGGGVYALAYDSSNNKLFAGGQYSSQIHAGNYEPFVCSLNDASGGVWNKDASNIWQAFNGDIDISLLNVGSGVYALAYDSTNNKLFAGGNYRSISQGSYEPFVCSLAGGSITWKKESIPNPGSGGQIRALVIDDVIAGGNDGNGNPIMYMTTINAAGAPVCFQKGTRIETPTGKIAVEELKEGDMVLSKGGRTVAIVKMVQFIGDAETCGLYVLPANALKHGVPAQDLYMSNNHAYKDEKGRWRHMKCSSQTKQVDKAQIEYYHIITSNYFSDTLYAENVEVETCFIDKGDGVLMLWECDAKKCVPMRCCKPVQQAPELKAKKSSKGMFGLFEKKEPVAPPSVNTGLNMWKKTNEQKTRMLWAYNKDGTQEAMECTTVEL